MHLNLQNIRKNQLINKVKQNYVKQNMTSECLPWLYNETNCWITFLSPSDLNKSGEFSPRWEKKHESDYKQLNIQ